MEHYLIAALVGFVGDFDGVWVFRQDRDCELIVEGEDLFGGCVIAAEIVQEYG
jgi:hypothetical protein